MLKVFQLDALKEFHFVFNLFFFKKSLYAIHIYKYMLFKFTNFQDSIIFPIWYIYTESKFFPFWRSFLGWLRALAQGLFHSSYPIPFLKWSIAEINTPYQMFSFCQTHTNPWNLLISLTSFICTSSSKL